MLLIPLVLSLTVHEWAHAWSASRLGDDTAARQGRLTLDPIAHIDPIGTLLLPLLGVPFGWAKPVPINPARFSRRMSMSKGIMLTAAAGPASNLFLAVVCGGVYVALMRTVPEFVLGTPAVDLLLRYGMLINVALAVFNMLPVPPLDGSRVAEGLMPDRWRKAWDAYSRYGAFLLLGIILLPMFVPGLSPVGWVLSFADGAIRAVIQ